jgi:hypothetical protein
LKRLARDKNSSLFGLFVSGEEKKVYNIENRLECFTTKNIVNIRACLNSEFLANISQSWKGLPGTNTLAYLASLSVMKKKFDNI